MLCQETKGDLVAKRYRLNFLNPNPLVGGSIQLLSAFKKISAPAVSTTALLIL